MPGIVELPGATRELSVAEEQMMLLGRRSAKAAFLVNWRDRPAQIGSAAAGAAAFDRCMRLRPASALVAMLDLDQIIGGGIGIDGEIALLDPRERVIR